MRAGDLESQHAVISDRRLSTACPNRQLHISVTALHQSTVQSLVMQWTWLEYTVSELAVGRSKSGHCHRPVRDHDDPVRG